MSNTRRLISSQYVPAILVVSMILCLGSVIRVCSGKNPGGWSPETNRQAGFVTLRGVGRRLGGYTEYEVNSDQLMGAEFGFFVGVAVMLVMFVCLCACCTRRCSLCDMLTCFCLWEICCDDRHVGDFRLI